MSMRGPFAFVILILAALCPGQTTQPNAQDWPAFHGGGALVGEAAPIGPPPMRVRWTYRADELESVPILGSAAIVGNSAYVADRNGILHSIDLVSGKRNWIYTSKEGFETTPLIHDGRILLGDLVGVFHAVSAADGKAIWTFDSGAPIHSSANIANGNVVFGNDGADIFSLNPVDGKPVWQAKAGDRVNSAPAVAETVFISGCDSILRSLAFADGAEKAATELKGLSAGSPAIVDGKIVLGTDGGFVQCLDFQTRNLLWAFDGIGSKAMVYSSPAVSNGIVVVGARDRSVWALDLKTGEKKWSFPTRGDVDSSPVISGGRVYIGSNDRKFYIIDLQTGEELWSFTASRAVSAAPAIGRGVVVVGDEAGSVYCLEPAPR